MSNLTKIKNFMDNKAALYMYGIIISRNDKLLSLEVKNPAPYGKLVSHWIKGQIHS